MTSRAPFSIVIPVADKDFRLVPRTLPSWMALGSDDVIIVTDWPPSIQLQETISQTVRNFKNAGSVHVMNVPVDPGFHFHQAKARRAGFLEARHDLILTGDIDLIVRRKVVKALSRVGTNQIGLVSFSKVRTPTSLLGSLRAVSYLLMNKLKPPRFVGLYAFWRPYWSETEDKAVMRLRNPRLESYPIAGLGILGEDTYLYICMKRKYRCLHDNSVCAIDIAGYVEDLPRPQFEWGRVMNSRSLLSVLLASVFLTFPTLLRGFLYQRSVRSPVVDVFGKDFNPKELPNGRVSSSS